MIYFIQIDNDGPIKIGISSDPIERMRQLQVSMPYDLHLLGVMNILEKSDVTYDPANESIIKTSDSDRSIELALHDRFNSHRIRGEWFHSNEELLTFINENCDKDVTISNP